MARFKYLGEKPRPGLVKKYGDCTVIRIPKKDGSVLELRCHPGHCFMPGSDIGEDITDERALRVMRADSRFEEVK
jgi:hypothetical protein